MKNFLFCVLAVLTLIGNCLRAQEIAGDWQGTLGGTGGLRNVLKISKSDCGLSAQLFSIDIGPESIPVSKITFTGSEITLTVDALHGSYTGRMSTDGTAITGLWNQGQPLALNFTRATKDTAWPIDTSPHQVEFVSSEKDVRIEVLDWGGKGRPLILLAGLGNTAHIFHHLASQLISSYHVYGITRRGYGESSSPTPTETNYLADRLGEDVLAVIDALKIDRPILVGHSIAGEELSSIGSRHPEKVAGLVYLDAGYAYAFYDRTRGDLTVDTADLRRKLAELNSAPGIHDRKTAVDVLLKSSLPQMEVDLREDEQELSKLPEEPTTAPIPGNAQEILTPTVAILMGEQKYSEVKVPVLAIFALPHNLGTAFKDNPTARATLEARDLTQTTAQANAFGLGVPTAHVVRLANASHFIFLSNESDVLREIKSFTAAVPVVRK